MIMMKLTLQLGLLLLGVLVVPYCLADDSDNSVIIPLRAGFRPEAIERGARKGSFYVTETVTLAIWKGDVETGKVVELVTGVDTETPNLIGMGMAYNREGDILFVAGGVAGTVTAYDGTTGVILGQWEAYQNGSFVNDCAVNPTVGVYCTNSFGPNFVFIPYVAGGPVPDPDAFQIIELGGEWEQVEGTANSNGIEVNACGNVLLGNIELNKIFLLREPLSGEAIAVQIIDNTGLGMKGAPDGLEISEDGKTLYVVDPINQAVNVLKFSGTDKCSTSGYELATVEAVITNDLFRFPTTGTLVGNDWFLVVNSRFDVCPPPGFAATLEEECTALFPFEVVGIRV